MARNYVRTVQDMERYYYGGASQTGYTYGSSDILKADSPLMSSTAGTYQAIYGRKVWSQLNQEFNAFSILPKKPWERSGWRILTERASFTKGGGIAENGVLPDTSRPEFLHVAAKPKTVAHTFDLSEVSMFLSDKDDGMGDVRQVLKEEMGKHHAEHINRMLLQDIDTPAGNDFESLDRLVSDPDKMTIGTAHVSATTDHDIYSITRDGSAAFHSAEVDVASSNRNLSLNQMDGLFQQLWTRGGNPKVMLTGYDTLMRVQQLLQSQQRFMDSKRITPTYNGVKGVPGLEAGFIVATYNGVPMIPTKDMPDEGASSLSRIYYLDTDYLWFQTAIPTQYYESGIETGDPFAINRLGQEGLYRTMGELWCSFFGASGSIRDLQ
ncbi:MAG: hypothetical protein CL581_09225 [Alteromonadaceae bacterium]|nr:hypothetical protein [Alteromonadaceae bacterium]